MDKDTLPFFTGIKIHVNIARNVHDDKTDTQNPQRNKEICGKGEFNRLRRQIVVKDDKTDPHTNRQ